MLKKLLQLSACLVLLISMTENVFANDRAQSLARQVKCPVCAGQPIAESNTEMAVAMRAYIREAIAAGQTDAQILQHFRDQYGDASVTAPPLASNTLLIWLLPVIIFLGGGWWLFKRR